MKKLFIVTAAVLLAACGGNMDHDHMGDSSHQAGQGIVISGAHVMPPFPGKDVAAGFFELTNHGADDTLLSVSSPISDNVEIHNHIDDNGVMKMRKVDGVDLPAGETIIFKPGSFHIMMFGAAIAETQDDVALTLNYKNAKPVTIIVPIGEPKEMNHSGH